MAILAPYLALQGKTREALGFYKEIFGGEITLMTFADSPMADQIPEDQKQNIVHGQLRVNDALVIMGSDMGGPVGITAGNNVQLCLACESADEIKRLFEGLSQDAQVNVALKTEFWGGSFAQLTDKYGFSWMLEYSERK